MNKKGFTLIELLVVIAIIGILASVVLTSLSSTRQRANNLKIHSQLSSIRSAAEIYYSVASVYLRTGETAACGTATTVATGMFFDVPSGMKNLGNTNNYPPTTELNCNASGQEYSVAAKMGDYIWCVDSTGIARGKTDGGTNYTALTGAATAAHAALASVACN